MLLEDPAVGLEVLWDLEDDDGGVTDAEGVETGKEGRVGGNLQLFTWSFKQVDLWKYFWQ